MKATYNSIAAIVVLLSCGHGPKVGDAHSVSEPKYRVAPRAGDSVTKYYYTVSSSVKSRFEVQDKKRESGGTSDLGLIFRLAKDTAGTVDVTITYDKLHVMTDNDGQHQDITARKGDTVTDPIGRMLGNILGSEINLILDSSGNIRQVRGTKELKQKILGAMNGADASVRTAVETQMDRLAGESFIRGTLQQLFKLVPDSVQYVGDSWTHSQESDGVKLTIATTYTLKDIDGHIANIVGNSEISDDQSAPILFMGQSFPAMFSGEQKSRFQVDLSTGLVTKGQANFSLKGTIEVFGREVPIRVESQRTLEGRRL